MGHQLNKNTLDPVIAGNHPKWQSNFNNGA